MISDEPVHKAIVDLCRILQIRSPLRRAPGDSLAAKAAVRIPQHGANRPAEFVLTRFHLSCALTNLFQMPCCHRNGENV
jgi:hypothetical protein